MADKEVFPSKPERRVITEHRGKIEGEMGRRSVFVSRHYEDGEEVYSMASLVPVGPSLIALAAQEHQKHGAVETEDKELDS